IPARIPDLTVTIALGYELCVPDLRDRWGKIKLKVPAVNGLRAVVSQRNAGREATPPVAILHKGRHDCRHFSRFQLLQDRPDTSASQFPCALLPQASLKKSKEHHKTPAFLGESIGSGQPRASIYAEHQSGEPWPAPRIVR